MMCILLQSKFLRKMCNVDFMGLDVFVGRRSFDEVQIHDLTELEHLDVLSAQKNVLKAPESLELSGTGG